MDYSQLAQAKADLDPNYDHETDQLVPCRCGFKPTHYSIYYSRTPYDVWCPHCKKQLSFAKCRVTGHHENAIDYWNKHLAGLTLEEMNKEVDEFFQEKERIESEEGATAKLYAYFWQKNSGEVLHQRW